MLKLSEILDLITDKEDREIIMAMMKKIMPKKSKHNFSLSQLSTLTPTQIGHNRHLVSKCLSFAYEFVYLKYKLDFKDSFDNENNDKLNWWYYSTHEVEENKMEQDFVLTRTYIWYNTDLELRREAITSFDLYITNIFIEFYTKVTKDYGKRNNRESFPPATG